MLCQSHGKSQTPLTLRQIFKMETSFVARCCHPNVAMTFLREGSIECLGFLPSFLSMKLDTSFDIAFIYITLLLLLDYSSYDLMFGENLSRSGMYVAQMGLTVPCLQGCSSVETPQLLQSQSNSTGISQDLWHAEELKLKHE